MSVKLAIFGVKSFVVHHSFGPIILLVISASGYYTLDDGIICRLRGGRMEYYPIALCYIMAPHRCHESAELLFIKYRYCTYCSRLR